MTLALSVTDDQLGRFFRRMVAIAERGEKSLPFDRLMDTLQTIHDGKLNPFAGGLRGKFIRTMSIMIGGVPKDNLIEQLGSVRRALNSDGRSMMNHELFATMGTQEMVTLIDLCPADLGFIDPSHSTTKELFDVKRLAEWSAANFDGYVIELCPAEVGPHFAIRYKNQPMGEDLWIAMEGIPVSDDDMCIFNVRHALGGTLWLSGDWAGPDCLFSLDSRFLFRLRKVVFSASTV